MSSIELLILFGISIAAFLRTGIGHAVNPFSWHWFGFHYRPGSFAASALIVVFSVLGVGRHGESVRGDQETIRRTRRATADS